MTNNFAMNLMRLFLIGFVPCRAFLATPTRMNCNNLIPQRMSCSQLQVLDPEQVGDDDSLNVSDYSDPKRRQFMSALMALTALSIDSAPSLGVTIQQSQEDPAITHKVTFNVRISRADGTFYVRDEVDPTPDNNVFTGSVTLGLYGDYAPNHVERFLKYVDVNYSPLDDIPFPSFSRSQFTTLNQSTGLLTGGVIPGLHTTNFNGASALEYSGRITVASLWADDFKGKTKLLHSRPGLLTHKNLNVLPNFGITTRSAFELNSDHTVFGTVLPSTSTSGGEDFLSRCVELPTYSNTKPAGTIGQESNANTRAAGEVASSVYSFQKDLFRSAAKTFGDTRLDNVYEGKILRRVEVTSVKIEQA
jgi:cyclophilin family peptidyl-prolyl cis-trans isomerase